MITTTVDPKGVTVADLEKQPTKKPFHRVADEYIGCLLAEINAYQVRERAWQTLTTGQIPDRDLKAARGATNSMQETYRVRLAEEAAK